MTAAPTQLETENSSRVPSHGNSGSPTRSRRSSKTAAIIFGVLATVSIVLLFSGLLTRETVALVAVILMVSLIMLYVPIGVSIGLPGVLGLISIGGWEAGFSALADVPFDSVASWSLSVLPMFILMGMILWKSGLTHKIYNAAHHWLSWLPGGLSVSTLAAGAGLAAVSGSTIGTTYALGRVATPEMLNAGYDKRMISGTLLLSGLPGQLIPPSIMLILYAGIAETPVGQQLTAGIMPGLMIAAICIGQILFMSFTRPSLVGRGTSAKASNTSTTITWGMRWASLAPVWPLPVLIVIVIGGMVTGLLTATEAGAAGALGAILIMAWNLRGGGLRAAGWTAGKETVKSVGSIFLLLIGAHFLTRMIQVTGIGFTITDFVEALGLNALTFMLAMLVVYILLGMFMDPLAMMLITVPLLLPTLSDLGISPIVFGVFVVFLGELAIITPPVGILSYILHDVMRGATDKKEDKVTLREIFTAILWFAPAILAFALLLIFFPEISTLLIGNS